jgi:hypothetical protein
MLEGSTALTKQYYDCVIRAETKMALNFREISRNFLVFANVVEKFHVIKI